MGKTVFESVADDENSGDLGSARGRLMSFLSTQGYDADIIQDIARISVRMHDLREAGRWYFMCNSQDAAAAGAIERFTRSCGHDANHISSQLPLKRMFADASQMPEALRQRLQSLTNQQVTELVSEKPPPRGWRSVTEQRLTLLGCGMAFLVIASLSIIGIVTVFQFVWK